MSVRELQLLTPWPLAALGGVLARSCPLPHLERLSLRNMLVDADDFAPPFSAPNLRHMALFNCGQGSLEAVQTFIKNPEHMLDVWEGDRAGTACLCECVDPTGSGSKCGHKKFEHPKGFGSWVYFNTSTNRTHDPIFEDPDAALMVDAYTSPVAGAGKEIAGVKEDKVGSSSIASFFKDRPLEVSVEDSEKEEMNSNDEKENWPTSVVMLKPGVNDTWNVYQVILYVVQLPVHTYVVFC